MRVKGNIGLEQGLGAPNNNTNGGGLEERETSTVRLVTRQRPRSESSGVFANAQESNHAGSIPAGHGGHAGGHAGDGGATLSAFDEYDRPYGIGQFLAERRMEAELTLQEVSRQTCISVRSLEFLENELWSDLPGYAHTMGFVKAYVQCLGLNETEVAEVIAIFKKAYERHDPATVQAAVSGKEMMLGANPVNSWERESTALRGGVQSPRASAWEETHDVVRRRVKAMGARMDKVISAKGMGRFTLNPWYTRSFLIFMVLGAFGLVRWSYGLIGRADVELQPMNQIDDLSISSSDAYVVERGQDDQYGTLDAQMSIETGSSVLAPSDRSDAGRSDLAASNASIASIIGNESGTRHTTAEGTVVADSNEVNQADQFYGAKDRVLPASNPDTNNAPSLGTDASLGSSGSSGSSGKNDPTMLAQLDAPSRENTPNKDARGKNTSETENSTQSANTQTLRAPPSTPSTSSSVTLRTDQNPTESLPLSGVDEESSLRPSSNDPSAGGLEQQTGEFKQQSQQQSVESVVSVASPQEQTIPKAQTFEDRAGESDTGVAAGVETSITPQTSQTTQTQSWSWRDLDALDQRLKSEPSPSHLRDVKETKETKGGDQPTDVQNARVLTQAPPGGLEDMLSTTATSNARPSSEGNALQTRKANAANNVGDGRIGIESAVSVASEWRSMRVIAAVFGIDYDPTARVVVWAHKEQTLRLIASDGSIDRLARVYDGESLAIPQEGVWEIESSDGLHEIEIRVDGLPVIPVEASVSRVRLDPYLLVIGKAVVANVDAPIDPATNRITQP